MSMNASQRRSARQEDSCFSVGSGSAPSRALLFLNPGQAIRAISRPDAFEHVLAACGECALCSNDWTFNLSGARQGGRAM